MPNDHDALDRRQRDPVVEGYRCDVDTSLTGSNLSLTVEQRFLQLIELQRFADELREGVRAERRPGTRTVPR